MKGEYNSPIEPLPTEKIYDSLDTVLYYKLLGVVWAVKKANKIKKNKK